MFQATNQIRNLQILGLLDSLPVDDQARSPSHEGHSCRLRIHRNHRTRIHGWSPNLGSGRDSRIFPGLLGYPQVEMVLFEDNEKNRENLENPHFETKPRDPMIFRNLKDIIINNRIPWIFHEIPKRHVQSNQRIEEIP